MTRLAPPLCLLATLLLPLTAAAADAADADDWQTDKIWHDGLVEKAVYAASRVVYGKPRAYTATFFTNKEQHDRKSLTKAGQSPETIEVWKHNQIEDIPTPNYAYHYVTTSHLAVGNLAMTRHESSSQEFCGTSFKQYAIAVWPGVTEGSLNYFSFSYMPEAGRKEATVDRALHTPYDALPLRLRAFDFTAKSDRPLSILPSQKSNRPTPHEPFAATVKYAGEDDGAHKLELRANGEPNPRATYWMAKDRLHVMLKYAGADGQTYELKEVSRVNYWTIKGE